MYSSHFPFSQILRNFFCASIFLLLIGAVHAAELLHLDLSANRRTAEVQVPEGVTRISVQRSDGPGAWKTYVSAHVEAGAMSFDLPAVAPGVVWRAVVTRKAVDVANRKFPAGFYRGKNQFGSSLSDGGTGAGSWVSRITTLTGETAGTDATPDVAVPVEADIWKVDGDRIYYFNQLRGLQVLDLANPKDPRLIASLRMPAVGQDLYLLPGEGTTREVVLLTEGYSRLDRESTRIRIVKVTEGEARVTFSQEIPGHLADSRMVGNRLIVATTEWSGGVIALAKPSTLVAKPNSVLSEWILASGEAPRQVGNFPIIGENPLIAAGADWLAVAVTPVGQWSFSEVTVFGLKSSGLIRLTPSPIRTAGVIADKFKIQWSKNTLTTISESNARRFTWSPRTVLETFRVWGPGIYIPAIYTGGSYRLGSLELAKGESLYATRFAGDKAYIVTYLQKDPLWIVDLTDPRKPAISGHLEVPGWSTHLEPLGSLLFSIGWDAGSVVASLFDVANPAAPQLLRRITLGDGSYSEATWDEKALKVLPDAGLVLVPIVSAAPAASGVRLLDLDIAGRDLRERGVISHEFEPRRADLVGDSVISISQRVLVAADIGDRDQPALLSEVSLAWPVDRICDAGDFVLQVEDGTSYGDGRATVRVSSAGALEQILSETDLGDGTVRAADFRDGKFYVVRQTVYPPVGSGLIAIHGSSARLVLDVYDGSALPELSLLGSCSRDVGTDYGYSVSEIQWPQPNRPCVVVNSRWPYFWDRVIISPPILLQKEPAVGDALPRIFPPIGGQVGQKPRLLVFDVTRPDAPAADAPVNFGSAGATPGNVVASGGGLVVVGTGRQADVRILAPAYFYPTQNSVNVLEVGQTGPAVARPGIDLPGTLFAVTDFNEQGFLAFSRSMVSQKTASVTVSASDGFDAFLGASREVDAQAAVTAGGRRLFVATGNGVSRYTLADDKTWVSESELRLGWRAEALRFSGGKVLGVLGKWIFAADADAPAASRWKFPTWNLWLDKVSVAANGDLLVPFGDYGAERLSEGK